MQFLFFEMLFSLKYMQIFCPDSVGGAGREVYMLYAIYFNFTELAWSLLSTVEHLFSLLTPLTQEKDNDGLWTGVEGGLIFYFSSTP